MTHKTRAYVADRINAISMQDQKLTLAGRIRALKDPDHCGQDFDGRTWAWLVALGIVLPAILLIVGWWL